MAHVCQVEFAGQHCGRELDLLCAESKTWDMWTPDERVLLAVQLQVCRDSSVL